jgi:hypothetical protein
MEPAVHVAAAAAVGVAETEAARADTTTTFKTFISHRSGPTAPTRLNVEPTGDSKPASIAPALAGTGLSRSPGCLCTVALMNSSSSQSRESCKC